MAKVAIIDQNSGKKFHVQLPTNVKTAQVLPTLIKTLKLPTEGAGGEHLQYDLTLETADGKVRLAEDDNLAEVGVVDGVTIRIFPKMRTGEVPKSEWKYLDLDIQLIALKRHYRSKIINSPVGEASGIFKRPRSEKIQLFILQMGYNRKTRSVGLSQLKLAREFGSDLFERLFNGDILACLTASLQKTQAQDCGLRIKLILDDAPDLMSLPWEFLYYPARRVFLACQEHTPIVRFLGLPDEHRSAGITLPLRILGMVSSPTDLVTLDVEQEKFKMKTALASLIHNQIISLDWVDGGSLAALENHLHNTNRQYHIFHFIGHGGFDEQDGEGFLSMDGMGKRYEAVTGERLGHMLQIGKQHFRLVVLNACEGGRVGPTNPFPGLAPSITQICNMPATVAMQFDISDEAAITFASRFYSSLAKGSPIDTAATSARLAILAMEEQKSVEWGTPVLYMRSSDGQLFD